MLGVQPIVIGLLLEALYALYASEGSLLKALGLFSLIKNSPSLSPVVERLLEACSDKKLDQVHSMELQNSIRTKIEKFASDIEKIGQGKLEFDSTSWLSVDTKFLSEVKTELLATSHADATTVWGSQVGKKYWELNKEKIREGMSCARVFIVSRTQVTGDELPRLIEIMENQHSGGVEVKVVMEESIDHRLRRDIAIFDKAILSHTMLTLGGYTSGTDVYWNPADVNPAIEDFDLL